LQLKGAGSIWSLPFATFNQGEPRLSSQFVPARPKPLRAPLVLRAPSISAFLAEMGGKPRCNSKGPDQFLEKPAALRNQPSEKLFALPIEK
jgi:hypothetical protein